MSNGLTAGNVPAAEDKAACRRNVQPCDAIEERGFPGPVGAYQAHHFALCHVERDVEVGMEPAERHPETLYLQKRLHVRRPSLRRVMRPHMPPGSQAATTIMMVE